jgi:hypothetical protein
MNTPLKFSRINSFQDIDHTNQEDYDGRRQITTSSRLFPELAECIMLA